ncbi:hypothetical protein HK098_002010 [Nowakowskiella sp. JEL0407]|nr:hypothetical protein HK098_002010 [Nowakowskiella sp. JEL0407]
MHLVLKFAVLASVSQLALAACSDLGLYLTYSRICYDSYISCSQYFTTVSGSFCSGGTFTTPLADYRCNSVIKQATDTTSSCIIAMGTNLCYSNTATYKTATVSGVYLVGPEGSPCYSPLNQAQTQYEVVVFRTGTINGIVATVAADIPSPASSVGSPSPSLSTAAVEKSGDGGNNNTVIIIGVVAGVVVVIAAVVAYVLITRMKKKPAAQPPMQQQPMQQQAYYPQQQYLPDSANKTQSMYAPPYPQQPYQQPPSFPQQPPSFPQQPYSQPSENSFIASPAPQQFHPQMQPIYNPGYGAPPK